MANTPSSKPYYIGIDVGTGSVRAALVHRDGTLLATSTADITTWRSPNDHRIFEQSTENIWKGACTTIRECLIQAQSQSLLDIASLVGGIGFDATCSLAVTDWEGRPVVVTKGEDLGKEGERNVILWADHRAEKEASLINATGSVVLDYVGGTMSLEMEIPKILWLKTHMPSSFSKCQFFDLPDYLTYRATGDTARSCCSLTCKCSFVSGLTSRGWDDGFFEKIGLGEMVERGYGQVGAGVRGTGEVLTAGMPVGSGLTKRAAEELGLVEGTPVGSALIDAYAGWLGTIGGRYKLDGTISEEQAHPSLEQSRHRLAAVAGTSTCFIVQSREGVFVDGVWGPYKDAVFPGWWMNEGGQSATGQLIDFILTTHHAYPLLTERARAEQKSIHTLLNEVLETLRTEQDVGSLTELTKDLHVYPDFHGNRSPIADPRMRGSIVGLDLDSSLSSLARLFHATLTSIALQTRHIIDTLNVKGHTINTVYVSGGQAKNETLVRLIADVCNVGVVVPDEDEGGKGKASGVSSVVLGSAMLGRFAAEVDVEWSDEKKAEVLWDIMVEMTSPGKFIQPSASEKEKRLLEAKYEIFRESVEVQRRWRRKMEEATAGA